MFNSEIHSIQRNLDDLRELQRNLVKNRNKKKDFFEFVQTSQKKTYGKKEEYLENYLSLTSNIYNRGLEKLENDILTSTKSYSFISDSVPLDNDGSLYLFLSAMEDFFSKFQKLYLMSQVLYIALERNAKYFSHFRLKFKFLMKSDINLSSYSQGDLLNWIDINFPDIRDKMKEGSFTGEIFDTIMNDEVTSKKLLKILQVTDIFKEKWFEEKEKMKMEEFMSNMNFT